MKGRTTRWLAACLMLGIAFVTRSIWAGTGCPNNCSGNGVCVSGNCSCNVGWVGVDCSIWAGPGCPNNCSGHGTCVEPNCSCDAGWGGVDCSIPFCGGPPDGDMNNNVVTNGVDIDLFVDAVLASSTNINDICAGDFSGNLVMDVSDTAGFVTALLN
jgi:hypothetical protein